jgi:hypothetical protein
MLKFWEKWSKTGMQWPLAYDPVSQQPSLTLTCSYLSFVLAFVSVVFLHIYPQVMIVPKTTAIAFWLFSTVFYLLRKLTKAKLDLKEKSFEFDSGDTTVSTPKPSKPTNDDLAGS